MGISLEKRSEVATVSLVKLLTEESAKGNDLGELTAQVVLVNDFSGSMFGRYNSGEVQELAERALGLSLSGLDDDGNIQVFFFDHGTYDPIVVDGDNYAGAIPAWARQHTMGGTDYLPVIRQVIKYTKSEGMQANGKPPILVIFMTDGATGNESKIQKELVTASDLPIFWQFLGLGYRPDFLKKLDTMGGRKTDNVGLFDVPAVGALNDEQFYDEIIGEFFRSWLPDARAKRIVTA